MAAIFNCPFCGATLTPDGDAAVLECDYCGKPAAVPVELREPGARAPIPDADAGMDEQLAVLSGLPFEKALEILQMVRDGNKLFAMQVYRSSVDTTLVEAKAVVDRLEAMLKSPGAKSRVEAAEFLQPLVSPGKLPDSVQQVRRIWRVITFITLIIFLFTAAALVWVQLAGAR